MLKKILYSGGSGLATSFCFSSLEIAGSEIPVSGVGIGATVNLGYAW